MAETSKNIKPTSVRFNNGLAAVTFDKDDLRLFLSQPDLPSHIYVEGVEAPLSTKYMRGCFPNASFTAQPITVRFPDTL